MGCPVPRMLRWIHKIGPWRLDVALVGTTSLLLYQRYISDPKVFRRSIWSSSPSNINTPTRVCSPLGKSTVPSSRTVYNRGSNRIWVSIGHAFSRKYTVGVKLIECNPVGSHVLKFIIYVQKIKLFGSGNDLSTSGRVVFVSHHV